MSRRDTGLRFEGSASFFGKCMEVYPDKLEDFLDEKSESTFYLWK